MGMRDELRGAADRARLAQAKRRADRFERRDHRMHEQVSAMRAELDHEREGRRELAALLRQRENEMAKGHPILRTLMVGGVAYVLGAKAGRGRYEEILAKARGLRERFGGTAEAEETHIEPRPTGTTPDAIASSASRA